MKSAKWADGRWKESVHQDARGGGLEILPARARAGFTVSHEFWGRSQVRKTRLASRRERLSVGHEVRFGQGRWATARVVGRMRSGSRGGVAAELAAGGVDLVPLAVAEADGDARLIEDLPKRLLCGGGRRGVRQAVDRVVRNHVQQGVSRGEPSRKLPGVLRLIVDARRAARTRTSTVGRDARNRHPRRRRSRPIRPVCVDRHELVAKVVVGGMQRHGQPVAGRGLRQPVACPAGRPTVEIVIRRPLMSERLRSAFTRSSAGSRLSRLASGSPMPMTTM